MPTTAHARADSHGAAVGHRAPVPVLVTAGPVSVPIGTPIALLFVAAALIFLPTVPGAAG
ncbi:hypothetical protein [Kitasatospora sp. NPDC093679]|uniref:hypothetical protein n=1 Tax=Kitasatospora sp. NPDC093679 TaxID=3154983 RepID=UPI003443A15D